MPKYARGGLRILGVLALAAVMAPAAITLASDAGRDFSRCIGVCNDLRQACTANCTPVCTSLHPVDLVARAACVSTCTALCDTESDDCKAVCKAIKNNPCPTEP
ncbi:MAG: hypothetical protein ACREAA_18630 [Candidatus Polarisedimenticolia bacterium]